MPRKQPQVFKQSELIYVGNLPKEMIQLIADYLDLKELSIFLSVNKSHYLLANQYNSFWKKAAIEKVSAKARISYSSINADQCVASIQSLPECEKEKNYRFEIAKLYWIMKNKNAVTALQEHNEHYKAIELSHYNDELSGDERSVTNNEFRGRCLAAGTMPIGSLVGFMIALAIVDSIAKSGHAIPVWASYILLIGLVLTGCAVGSLPLTIPTIKQSIMNARINKSNTALSRLDDVVVVNEPDVPTETTSLILN